jgi:predicted phage tail protein|tara:strand:+ start:670 stop:1215 length:546 start_codon:yes stop_codon:yes gene_type:complete
MKQIFLHDKLGEKFGREWSLDVSTPAEAIRAICVNEPSFHKYIAEKSLNGVNYALKIGKQFISKEEIDLITTDEKPYHIIPAPAGSGELAIMILMSVLAAAVSYVLFSQSKPPRPEDPVQKSSYLFQGATNTAAQGNFVPIGYGRLRVGSAVISASTLAAPMSQITHEKSIDVNILEPNIS